MRRRKARAEVVTVRTWSLAHLEGSWAGLRDCGGHGAHPCGMGGQKSGEQISYMTTLPAQPHLRRSHFCFGTELLLNIYRTYRGKGRAGPRAEPGEFPALKSPYAL